MKRVKHAFLVEWGNASAPIGREAPDPLNQGKNWNLKSLVDEFWDYLERKRRWLWRSCEDFMSFRLVSMRCDVWNQTKTGAKKKERRYKREKHKDWSGSASAFLSSLASPTILNSQQCWESRDKYIYNKCIKESAIFTIFLYLEKQ